MSTNPTPDHDAPVTDQNVLSREELLARIEALEARARELEVERDQLRDVGDPAVGPEQSASEERYRTLFNSIDQGFCTLEVSFDDSENPLDYRFLEISPSFERQTGIQNGAGRWMREIAPTQDEHWFEIYGRVALTGEPARFESYSTPLGRWWTVYAFRIQDPRLRRVGVLFNDITERKRAETELEASAARDAFRVKLTDALRPLSDPIEVQAVASRVLAEHLGANRAFYGEITTDDDFIVVERDYTSDASSFVGQHQVHDFGPTNVEALRGGHTLVLADTFRDPRVAEDRETFAATSIGAAVAVPLIKGGRWAAALAVHQRQPRPWSTDEVALIEETAERTWAAVERARAEAALRQSEERLRRSLEIDTVGVIFFDPAGDVTWANEAFLRMGDYTRDDITEGRLQWDALTPPEWMPASQRAIEQLRTTGSTTPYEKEYIRKDGSRWWGLFAAKGLTEYEGVEFILDITDQKRAEAAQAHSHQQIEAALRTRDEFMAAAAHDLRTPLTSIKGMAQLLHRQVARTDLPESARLLEGLTGIDASATRMVEQIDQLLDLTRLQTGQPLELRRRPTELVDLTRRIAGAQQQTTERHRIRVEATEPEISGMWDQARLERVLDNLISNAIKYSPEGGDVTITVAKDSERAILMVRDQGVGIPVGDRERIFERFQRAGNAGQIVGTGIGLASAQQVVAQHGGSITVDSQEGHGSVFTVSLPLVADDNEQADESRRSPAEPSAGSGDSHVARQARTSVVRHVASGGG